MVRKPMVALLLVSSLSMTSCVIAIGKWKVSSFDDDTTKSAAAKHDGAEIDEVVQHQVAVHEAGHAIAMAILFSVDEVQKVTVNAKVDSDGNLGVAHWTPKIDRRYGADDMYNAAAVSLAGRAADILINGGPEAGAGEDLANANSRLWNAYITYGLHGSPLVYDSVADTPPEIRKAIEKDILDAEILATAVIAANDATVRALADDLMGITLKEGKRVMEQDVFKAFCDMHPLVDPRGDHKKPKKEKKAK